LREALGGGLRLQGQAADGEDMALGHGALGPVAHVGGEIPEITQRRRAAVDMAGAGAIDQEDVIGAGPAGDIDIFPELDRALGARGGSAARRPRSAARPR
jgi:hypothetical protein